MADGFYGTHFHNLDGQGRLAIPARLREALPESGSEGGREVFLTCWRSNSIAGFSPEGWQRLVTNFDEIEKGERSELARAVFSYATSGVLDSQGRVQIPEHLKEYAGIDKAVVVVGVHNRFEIWEPERWKQSRLQFLPKLDGLLDQIKQQA